MIIRVKYLEHWLEHSKCQCHTCYLTALKYWCVAKPFHRLFSFPFLHTTTKPPLLLPWFQLLSDQKLLKALFLVVTGLIYSTPKYSVSYSVSLPTTQHVNHWLHDFLFKYILSFLPFYMVPWSIELVLPKTCLSFWFLFLPDFSQLFNHTHFPFY